MIKSILFKVGVLSVALTGITARAEVIPQGVIVKVYNKTKRDCEIDRARSSIFAQTGLPSIVTSDKGSWQISDVQDLSESGKIQLRLSAIESGTQEIKVVDLVIKADESTLSVFKDDPNIGNRNIQVSTDKQCAPFGSTSPLLVNSIEYSVVQ